MDGLIGWLAREILPHEASVRAWLRRNRQSAFDADDLIQEAYCKLAAIEDRSVIGSGKAYFFAIVRNLMLEQVRRQRIVRIDMMAEIESLSILDEEALADRVISAREQLDLIQRLVAELPPRCRDVVRLRRIEGLSQRETARRLGVTENVVEKEIARGLRTIMSRWGELDRPAEFRDTTQEDAERGQR